MKTLEEARAIVRRCYCRQCGALRVATRSGVTCGNCSADRIALRVSNTDLRMAPECKRLLDLPVASEVEGYKVRCRFTIKGRPGDYRPYRKGRANGEIVEAVDTHERLRVRLFVPVKAPRRETTDV